MKLNFKVILIIVIGIIAFFGILLNLGWLYAIFFLVGFIAQLVDGALGMGFGLTSTATLLAFGINPTIISGSVHTAETFTTLASGISHFRLKNVDKDLFRKLAVFGTIAAIAGAIASVLLNNFNDKLIRGVVAAYVGVLGIRLVIIFFRYSKNKQHKKKINMKILAVAGGFLDSFGGGGWGPIVTTTLTNHGEHTPRKIIGTVNTAEFFVTIASSITFLIAIGISGWQTIVALALGGVIAAPLAAKITSKVSAKYLTLAVGILVIIWSIYVFTKII